MTLATGRVHGELHSSPSAGVPKVLSFRDRMPGFVYAHGRMTDKRRRHATAARISSWQPRPLGSLAANH